MSIASVPTRTCRRASRNAARDAEFAAQGLAFASESADLRERAGRYASIIEAGGSVDADRVRSVVRAFRSYEPFLADRDRTLNDAARRRLAAAVRPGTALRAA